jgi:hypothetical protein
VRTGVDVWEADSYRADVKPDFVLANGTLVECKSYGNGTSLAVPMVLREIAEFVRSRAVRGPGTTRCDVLCVLHLRGALNLGLVPRPTLPRYAKRALLLARGLVPERVRRNDIEDAEEAILALREDGAPLWNVAATILTTFARYLWLALSALKEIRSSLRGEKDDK